MGYTFKDKMRSFCKGLVSGRPFRQVALEGLRRGVSGRLGERYAQRLAFWGTPGEIYNTLAAGCSETAQGILAEGFSKKFNEKKELFNMIIELETGALDKTSLETRRDEYERKKRREVRELLELGKITSERAQQIFEMEFMRVDRWQEAMKELEKSDRKIEDMRSTLADNW